MKREINCPECVGAWRGLQGKYPGEHIRIVPGTLWPEWGRVVEAVRCDQCGMDLEGGAQCFAVTVYTPQTPWSPWEAQYIDVGPEEEIVDR